MGMSEAGIEITDDAQAFSLKKLAGLQEGSMLDAIVDPRQHDDEDVAAASMSDEDDKSIDGDQDDNVDDADNDDDDDEEDTVLLERQMEALYEQYVQRRKDSRHLPLVKRPQKQSKITKRALAGAALVEDHTVLDGDQEAYAKMINPDDVRAYICIYICYTLVRLSVVVIVLWCAVSIRRKPLGQTSCGHQSIDIYRWIDNSLLLPPLSCYLFRVVCTHVQLSKLGHKNIWIDACLTDCLHYK
jgi:hypothetical protein